MPEFAIDRPLVVFIAVLLSFVVSYAGAMLAMNSGAFLDDPNHRSSHDHAVSRAGGLAMLAAAIAGLFVVAAFAAGDGFASPPLRFLVLGVLAGLVGLADDHLDLPAIAKFAGQIGVAGLFVWWVGPLQSAAIPVAGVMELGPLGVVVTIFWIVAFMNVFNFMDGVNGIAGGAALMGLIMFAFASGAAGAGDAAAIALITASAAGGFLPANIVRGKLFMGDCGSHFLAFMIAALAVFAANASDGAASFYLLPTIFLPFIIDVAFTLAHRAMRRQNILIAHREHIYQLILRRGASHATVASLYAGAIGICAGGAFLMLTIAPAWMWIAPAILAVVFFLIAIWIFQRAADARMMASSAR